MKDKTITEKLSDSHYQPSKAEMEEECNMPELSEDDIKVFFFEPEKVGRDIG